MRICACGNKRRPGRTDCRDCNSARVKRWRALHRGSVREGELFKREHREHGQEATPEAIHAFMVNRRREMKHKKEQINVHAYYTDLRKISAAIRAVERDNAESVLLTVKPTRYMSRRELARWRVQQAKNRRKLRQMTGLVLSPDETAMNIQKHIHRLLTRKDSEPTAQGELPDDFGGVRQWPEGF